MFLTWFFTRDDEELRVRALKFFGNILWVSAVGFVIFGYWYYEQFPKLAKDLFSIGAVTRTFAGNPTVLWGVVGGFSALAVLGGLGLYFNPKKAPLAVAFILLVGCMGLIGEFERVREFTRKPFIIYGYMYANGVRVVDVPLLNRDGFLKHAAFVPDELKTITEANKVEAGKYLYEMECRYCHTINGVNAIKDKVKSWDEAAIYARIGSLNSPATPFMPPFTGTDAERHALAAFLATLNETPALAAQR